MESKGSVAACRRELANLMREKAPETAGNIIERNRALVEARGEEPGADPEEVQKVVQVLLEHGFRAIEGREDPQPPPEVVTHARGLAWKPLRTSAVLRRYEAGAAVFKEHLRQARSCVKPYSEAGYADAERAVERAFEQLQDRVESAHIEERKELESSPETRKRKRVEWVLSGKPIYPPDDLDYDFSAAHIGVVGSGPGVEAEIRRLAKMLGGQLLIVQGSPERFWAWIGLKQESSAAGLKNVLKATLDPAVCVAIGDPAAELEGWRHTHREAEAAFPIATHRPGSVVSYADVGVLASIADDPLLQQSLRTQFLDPLACERDGGRSLLETLRTYFAHDRHGVSTSAALGVNPQTITNRLRRVEDCLGRSVTACGIGLEAAVLFAELTS